VKDLDLRRRGRNLIELTDERGDEIDAFGRRRHDERVGARLGRNANLGHIG
jgi:hypothetical protein